MPLAPDLIATVPPLSDFVLSYGGPSLVLTLGLVLGLPWVYLRWLRPRGQRWWVRLAVLAGLWGGLWVLVYGDVLWRAHEARHLCLSEGGLKVYRQAEAEGFMGLVDFAPWAAAGFRYVETEGNVLIRTELVDGKPVERRVDQPLARYQLQEVLTPGGGSLTRISLQMQDRERGEVLGEVLRFELAPGWVDRRLMGLLGAPLPAYCVGPKVGRFEKFPHLEDPLIAATLRPPGKPPVQPPRRPWRG